MIDIPCIIFAGGKSSRMGKDKSLLPFGDFSTLTEFQLHKLQKNFKNVYISCKDKSKFNISAQFIEDIQTENVYAPTTGFVATFHYLKCERFFAISVDTPFIDEHVINALVEQDQEGSDATIATLNHKMQPMCGIYHLSLEKSFLEMLQSHSHKLGYLLKKSKTHYVDFQNEVLFTNINNPQEYKKALTLV